MISLGKEYEVDELCTYIGNKEKRIWIVCALEKITKQIVSFNIGRRTNQTLKSVIDTLNLSKAKKIFTDKLKSYKSLIEKEIHKINRFATNSIERRFLTLRTHLKRFNRRTICFSKSLVMMNAILKIYFWSGISNFEISKTF
jgi:IS1 family transposase